MQVEDVAGYASRPGRATQGQGHLTICNGLLGQVVVDEKYVAARFSALAGLPSSPL